MAWVVVICFPLLGPQFSPFDGQHVSTVATSRHVFLAVLGFAGIYWVVSAKNWFKGPKIQGTAEELAAIEHDLAL